MHKTCEVCGREIPAERLEAVPDTELCMTHAEQVAKYGGEFKLHGSATSIGKTGSLKKNYGDVTVKKSRNFEAIDRVRREYQN